MKSMLPFLIISATMSSAAVLPSALPLNLIPNPDLLLQPNISLLSPSLHDLSSSNLSSSNSNLPDSRFEVEETMSGPLLPVDSALVNTLYFMSLISNVDSTQKAMPRAYSAPSYRDVQIFTYAWTESRFLIWGIYYAIVDMIKFVRFNDMLLDLYWEDRMVGRMKISVRNALDPGIGTGNLTQDLGNDLVHTNQTDTDETSDSRTAHPNDSHLNSLTADPPTTSVTFESVPGARPLTRNDVFLTFYTAMLHIAQFPSTDQLQEFQSDAPNKRLHLHLQELGPGIQYGQLASALFYVPTYMSENAAFGYRETEFAVLLDGEKVCLGTLIQGLVPVVERGADSEVMVVE